MNAPKVNEETLFEALSQLSIDQRAAYLEQACGQDLALRGRLEILLRAHERGDAFMAEPVAPAIPRNAGLPIPLTERLGDHIGHYKLLQQIGEGGCGVVYLAQQEEPVRRLVALKVIKLGMDTKQVVARFEAERQALALMDHPNIAKVLDAGATKTGRPYFVMELVRGVHITDYCNDNSLSTRERLELFVEVCQAIQHAHQKGIIHRDIKPSNVLVTATDGLAMPKVIDFGIAKAIQGRLTDETLVTRFEQFLGTPAYMSPEQAMPTSVDIDTRSDIYSLGVLLYEMLAGKTPFETEQLLAGGLEEMRRTIRETEPVRPSTRVSAMPVEEQTTTARRRRTEAPKLISLLQGDLDWIVMKCLEKDRARRYETANGLAKDIQRYLTDEPVLARPPSRIYEFQKTVRRHRVGFAAAAAVIATLAGGVLVSTWEAVRARRAEREQGHLRDQAVAEGKQARQAQKGESEQRQRAQQNVVHQYVANGTRLMNEGDLFGSLQWYAEALRLDAGEPRREEPHRIRIASVLRQCPKLLNVFTHGKMLYHAEFSPDGNKVVTASDDGTARVCDTTTGAELLNLPHDGEVYDATFSPDGLRIVTSCEDKKARVWDSQTGALLVTLPHGDMVWRSCFSPDGRLVATACRDRSAQLWNAATGERVGAAMIHESGVERVNFSPDGKLLGIVTKDEAAHVWDVASGQQLFQGVHIGAPSFGIGFSRDNRTFLTVSAASVHVWERDSHPFKERFPPLMLPGIHSAQFSPDGRSIVATSDEFTAQVWDSISGKPLFNPPVRHSGRILSGSVSPDGRYFATAGQDTVAQIWRTATGQRVGPPLKFIIHVKKVDFGPDGRRLLGNSCDQAARVWDLATSDLPGPSRPVFEDEHRIVSPDGRYALVEGQSNVVWIVDARSGERVAALPHQYGVSYASFSRNGRSVITACERQTAVSDLQNDIFLWDAATGRRRNSQDMSHPFQLLYAAFSPDPENSRILTCGFDFTARLWDARTGQPLSEPLRHREQIRWGAFSPDGQSVVTASWDRTVRVWDAAEGNPLTPPLVHKSTVVGAHWSPDGKRLRTVTGDDYLQIWDLSTGEPLTPPRKIQNSTDYPEAVPDSAVSQPDGELLCDNRPVGDLVLLAQMLAVGKIDAGGNVVPLQLPELTNAWGVLHEKYPAQFAATTTEAAAWHRREAQESELEGNLTAALFHIDFMLKKQPQNAILVQRRAEFSAALAAGMSHTIHPEDFSRSIPPRDPGAGACQIDLARLYNLRLQDSLNQNSDGDDFSDLSPGLHTFGGIRFDVRGLVHLSGEQVKAAGHVYPEKVSGIDVHKKCRRLHFLQASHWASEFGTTVGQYVLHYRDGQKRELSIVFGRDLQDKWFAGAPGQQQASDALPAWTGGSRLAAASGNWICLYKSTRENPLPEVDLVSIDFVSTMTLSAPFLVALTVE